MSEDKTAVHRIQDLLGETKEDTSPYLIIISAKTPATVGKMIKLEKGELVMGRAADTRICRSRTTASRAALQARDAAEWLTFSSSTSARPTARTSTASR
jgi:hypothetical protein